MRPSAANPDPHADNQDDANLDLHGDRDRDATPHGYTDCNRNADCDRNADTNPERDRDSHRYRYGVADDYAHPESVAKHDANRGRHSLRW